MKKIRKFLHLTLIALLVFPNFTYAMETENTGTEEYTIVTESQTWDQPKTIDKNLIIAPNVVVTIASGVRIDLNADLIIYGHLQNNGSLNLNGHDIFANNVNMGWAQLTGDMNYPNIGVFDPYGQTTSVGNLVVKTDGYPIPPITFNLPENNTVGSKSYSLQGNTVPGFKVKIGSMEVTAQQDGSFELPLNLQEGENTFDVSIVNVLNQDFVLDPLLINVSIPVDNDPPVLSESNPLNNSENISVDSAINLTFNEEIKAGTYFGNIKVVDLNNITVPIQIDMMSNMLFITPNDSLENDMNYNVIIPVGSLIDLAGNENHEVIMIAFKTKKPDIEEDLTSPIVNGTNPLNFSEGVPVESSIQFTFSEDIIEGTNYQNISVDEENNTAVLFDTNIVNNVLTITPRVTLGQGTNYNVTLPSDSLMDMSGNGMTETVTLNFMTEGIKMEEPKLPSKPTVNNVTEIDREITGTTDTGTTVYVSFGQVTWSYKENGDGAFKVTIPLLSAGTQIRVIAKDSEGRESEEVLLSVAPKEVVTGGTQVTGRIDVNTVWTKEKSPYNLVGDIHVTDGAKLSLSPGVKVQGSSYAIVVTEGTLESIGNPEDEVTISTRVDMSGWDDKERIGDFRYTNFDNLSSLFKSGLGSLTIKDSVFSGSTELSLNRSGGTIERNIFDLNFTTIRLNGSINHIIRNNIFNIGTEGLHTQTIHYEGGIGETIIEHNSFLSGNFDNAFISLGNSSKGLTAINNFWNTNDEELMENLIIDGRDKAADVLDYKPYLTSPHQGTPVLDKLIIQATAPMHKNYGVSVNTDIKIKFNEEMQVGEGGIKLGLSSAGTFIGIDTRVEGNELIISPKEPLIPNTRYQVSVSRGAVKSDSELMFESNASFYFITSTTLGPSLPSVTVVTDKSTSVTGTAEIGSTITIKVGENILGTATTTTEGDFTVPITKQKSGTILTVNATDNAGYVSEEKEVKVRDATAPTIPTVNEVTDKATTITGSAEVESKINVKVGTSVVGTGTTDSNGEFSFTITKQKAGTILEVAATDAAGNTSEIREITVIDVTAPIVPTVNEVTDKSTNVTGTAEISSIITVKTGTTIIGTSTTGSDGIYTVAIPTQKAGTKLTVTATDTAGNTSEIKEIIAIDVTAPIVPTVNEVTDKSTSVTGTAETGSTVTIKTEANILGTAIAAADGEFVVPINRQVVGTVLNVIATDTVGNISTEAKVTIITAEAEQTSRIAGEDRYATAVAISQDGWKSAETVVLATGADFPDALAGGPLAYKENAPILLTRSAKLHAQTALEIQRLNAKKVIILGSHGAVSKEVEDQLIDMGLKVERIGGDNRFATAALISKRLPSDQVVIAFGFNFPDAISISPYAAKNGIPILLTRSDRVPAETQNAVVGKNNTIVVGSTSVISEAVAKKFPQPVRYGGTTRYETGKEIITKLPMGTSKAFVATGLNFPDALAGSVWAAKNNAPILLVKEKAIPTATKDLISKYDRFTIFGSQEAVGEEVMMELDLVLRNK